MTDHALNALVAAPFIGAAVYWFCQKWWASIPLFGLAYFIASDTFAAIWNVTDEAGTGIAMLLMGVAAIIGFGMAINKPEPFRGKINS
jgi:hypothetical protein